MQEIILLLLWSFLHIIQCHPISVTPKVATEFIILHNNDMHARFEQTNAISGKCTPNDEISHKCYGGFARVATIVRKYREEARRNGTSVLFLNAGDTFTGTPWFTLFKDEIAAAFLNTLQPDATSLGNHEFDENVGGLVAFLNRVNFPVLACNLDLTKVPEIGATRHFGNSTILHVNNSTIGVIGYLTPDTKHLVAPNHVEFKPEIDSINVEAEKLKSMGINIIIALGHSGYQKDQEIAANCPEVDIVIGGHTNTFLYNGSQPDIERIEGPYPTIVTQKSGKRVPVVQAYAYTKYLGKLHVKFDVNGNLISFDGLPILLDASIPADDEFLRLLEVYRPEIIALENSIVGQTKVYLEGRSTKCRTEECNLGNLVADAMVHARVMENQGGLYWTDAPIAFIMGGGIRSSIEKRSDGAITETDVLTVLPFDNDVYVSRVSGKTVRNALEHSATIRDRDSNGGFLQMSGVHVIYDLNKKEGERVISVDVRCAECNVPVYEPLKETKMYNIIVPEFLLNGGDGHVFRENNDTTPFRLLKNDKDIFVNYLKQRSVVYPEVEGRIIVIDKLIANSSSNVILSLQKLLLIVFVFFYIY